MFHLLYSIEDEKGKLSSMEVKLPGDTDFADALLFATEFAKLIDSVTEGAVVRVGVGYTLDISTLSGVIKVAANAGSDVEEGAKFAFRTVNNFFTRFRVPTFSEDKVNAGSDSVNQVDTDVAAVITAVEDGIDLTGVGGSGVVQPCDSRGEDITSLSDAYESFQSS